MYAKWWLRWQVSGGIRTLEAHSPLTEISQTLYWTVVISTECKAMCGSRNFCQGRPGPTVRKQPFIFSPQLCTWFSRRSRPPLDPRMKAKNDLFSFPQWAVYLLMLWPSGVQGWYETIGKCANRLIIWASTRDFCKPYHRNAQTSSINVYGTRARGYKTFFILNPAEHETYPAHKC